MMKTINCQNGYVIMYIPIFMFMSGMTVENLRPQEILFILQSQAGSAAFKFWVMIL